MNKDNSKKACIHYTESEKIQLHTALDIPLKKGSQRAIVKGIIAHFKVNKPTKEIRTSIIQYMPTQQTESMKTANSLKRALGKASTPEQKKQAVSEFTNSLDAETKKLLGL
tara:strand:+ start:9799 stop:10131 length:333 start_codon:yes stop_codon:yes gene_type:complete